MKNGIIAKARSLTVVMLLLLAVSVGPAMAAGSDATCPTCKTCQGNEIAEGAAEVTVELTGAEKSIAVEKILQREDVKKLQKELKDKGFSETGTKASTVSVPLKDGSVVDVQVVTVEYVSPEGTRQDINYLQNQKTGESIVVLSTGGACLTCLIRLIASGGVCVGACFAGGVFTGGLGCIACLGLLSAWTACPCYHCACETLGQACNLAATCDW